MFKRFAFYERISTGWTLVVYHDDLPAKSVNGAQPERHGPYVVPEEYIDVDGTPNMGMIEKAFPNPFASANREPKEEELEWPLPDWAERKAMVSVIQPMQQLITKDGSRTGNAMVVAVVPSKHVEDLDIYLIVTDADNWIRATLLELSELFTPGDYILKDFVNPRSQQTWLDAQELGVTP